VTDSFDGLLKLPTSPGWWRFQSCPICKPKAIYARANGDYGIPQNPDKPDEGTLFDFEACCVGGPPFERWTGPFTKRPTVES